MALSKEKLGKYIERVERRNSNLAFGIEDVRGVSNNKEIQPTKANVSSRSFDRFQIVDPKEFVFNRRTTRMGERLGLGYNDSDRSFIFTEDYVAFRVKDEKEINPDFLYMFFRRPEFDRYVRYDSWGSATEFFNWEEMCDVSIDLPHIDIQQKYVDVYNAMVANQKAYEQALEDLECSLNANLEEVKHGLDKIELGDLIEEISVRNVGCKIQSVIGVNIQKQFMPSIANFTNIDLAKYKVIQKGQFAGNFMHVLRDEKLPFCIYSDDVPSLVSPAYPVFQTKSNEVLPEFIALWLRRPESDRYAWYICDSSVRGGLELKRFYEILIPKPSTTIQQSIVNIYKAYLTRREINEKLKAQIKDLCPVLIKGSLEEARKA